MSSRWWTLLIASLLVAALTFFVSRRLFGVGILLLPLFFWGARRHDK